MNDDESRRRRFVQVITSGQNDVLLLALQETHPKMGLGETPRRLSRKRCRCSSLKKYEDAFDTALQSMRKTKAFKNKWQSEQSAHNPAIGGRFYLRNNWRWPMGKLRPSQQLLGL